MEVSFFLPGIVPTKKNGKHSWRGRVVIDPDKKKVLGDFELLARSRWRGRPALTQAEVKMLFYVSHERADLDGGQTSLLDILKQAGVIVNDSMKHVRRIEASFIKVHAGAEGVEVSLRGEVKC